MPRQDITAKILALFHDMNGGPAAFAFLEDAFINITVSLSALRTLNLLFAFSPRRRKAGNEPARIVVHSSHPNNFHCVAL
jgi:hypothetical protein